MRLTAFGRDIAAELGASDWASEVSSEIAEEAAANALQPYQIDQACERYVRERLGAAMATVAGRVGFERGVKMDELQAVLHIVLRDVVLERVKGYQS